VPDEPLSMTARHYTSGDLVKAEHINELDPRADIILCIDARQLGLGNGSCGPGVIDKYLLHPSPVLFGYSLRFYDPSMGELSSVARLSVPRTAKGR